MAKFTKEQIKEFCTIESVLNFSSNRKNSIGVPNPEIVMVFKIFYVSKIDFSNDMCHAHHQGKIVKFSMTPSSWAKLRVFKEI